jgi:type IV pilus assembly protein PilA
VPVLVTFLGRAPLDARGTPSESDGGIVAHHVLERDLVNQRNAARRASRGFTLVELLIVVAMIGIMAALAILGYRRYLNAAHSSEAKAVISMIKNGEESYKAEMLQYLQASSTITGWYPNGNLNGKPSAWVNASHGDWPNWRMLNVNPDGPVRFGYVCRAGVGTTVEAPNVFATAPSIPALPSGTPWYMVQAKTDNDGNGKYAVFASTSLSGEIMVENEQE